MSKVRIVFTIAAVVLLIAGCTQIQRRSGPAFKVPPPPSPPGLKLSPTAKMVPGRVTSEVDYVPTDFALTGLSTQSGNKIVLTWQNGTPPFQPQSKPDVLSPWENFGPSTTQRSITNPAPYGFGKAFFRVRQAGVAALWAKTAIATSAKCLGVACDSLGNVIACGGYSGAVDFGNGPIGSSGNLNAFVVKYTSQGSVAWAKTFGGLGEDEATSVAVDRSNNIIVGGYFAGTADFGGITLTAPSPFSKDMFVAKYSPLGSLLWVRQFGGSSSDYVYALAVDGVDNIVAAGFLQSVNSDFGSGFILSNAGFGNVTLTKLNPFGTTLWAKIWGGAFQAIPRSVTFDRFGDVAVTGEYQGGAAMGGAVLPGSPGAFSSFVAKYSGADGSHRWSRGFGVSAVDGGNGIAADPNTGNVVITGEYVGAANFGGGPVGANTAGLYIAGYDSTGAYLWHKTLGSGTAGNFDRGNAVRIDSTGKLLLTGLKGTPWFINGTTQFPSGYVLMSFTVSGTAAPVFQWIKLPGPQSSITLNSEGLAVSRDSGGNPIASGTFGNGTLDLGGILINTPATASGMTVKYTE